MTILTLKLKTTYQFIRSYMVDNTIAPTTTEIAKGIGIKSRGVASRYVNALATAGLLTLTKDTHRNITLNDTAGSLLRNSIPILGGVGFLNLSSILEVECFAVPWIAPGEYIICKDAIPDDYTGAVVYETETDGYVVSSAEYAEYNSCKVIGAWVAYITVTI